MKDFNLDMQQQIESYILEQMSEEQQKSFEVKMRKDDDLYEEVMFQKSIYKSLNENDWDTIEMNSNKDEIKRIRTAYRSEDIEHLRDKIKSSEIKYFHNKMTKSQNHILKYTAAAILIISISLTGIYKWNKSKNIEHYYVEYADWNDLPSLKEKGIDNLEEIEIEDYYFNKEYDLIINLSSFIEKAQNTNLLVYLGASYFHTGNENEALRIFNLISELPVLDNSKGYWYKLLVYLKQEDIEKAKKTLIIIISDKNNYNYHRGLKLFEKLN